MRKPVLLFFFFAGCSLYLYSGVIQLPLIPELSADNHIFQQYCDDVLYARKALAGGKSFTKLPINFYRYTVKKDDTVIKIAARCSIPYDAIITLNGIESIETPLAGRMILLPTLPALYLPEKASSDIEKLTEALCKKIPEESFSLNVPQPNTGGKKLYRCFPNALLDGTVRNFFFRYRYRFPLDNAVVTSPFGVRKSPFTGKPSYHAGIDLAAPSGSPIYACTSGEIIKIAYSNIYGNYIILRHDDGRESLYGHLSAVKSRLYQKVKSGTIIGNVGSTGMSTGPHLHFEIHEQGKAKNPVLFINTKQ
ncbi:MAG: LysM peptidoglycan-binding domain-containing M23 family metallopeptidase [Treponema sp.]